MSEFMIACGFDYKILSKKPTPRTPICLVQRMKRRSGIPQLQRQNRQPDYGREVWDESVKIPAEEVTVRFEQGHRWR